MIDYEVTYRAVPEERLLHIFSQLSNGAKLGNDNKQHSVLQPIQLLK